MSKKKEKVEVKAMLGRPSNNLKVGVVGLPNVGKSSFFNILCNMSIPAENFPFCTIEPNVSRVAVPDERFDNLCEHFKPAKRTPAYLTVTDIAGLVKNAHQGDGLGNAFLSHIRAVDGIFHVLRVFEDADVTHVEDSVDPVRDLEIISNELRLKDLDLLQTKVDGMARVVQTNKNLRKEYDICLKVLEVLKAGKDVRHETWTNVEIQTINTLQLITAKNVVYLLNLSERDFLRKKNKWLGKIKAWVDSNGGGTMIPFSVAFEQKVFDMPEDEAKAYCAEKKCQSVLPKIITTGYKNLDLIYFFTSGADEVRAWTIRKNTLAPQAAGTIHTDFEKGFVCAEVMSYEDFIEAGSEQACKAAGKNRQQGRNYVVQDGDIMYIKAGKVNAKK